MNVINPVPSQAGLRARDCLVRLVDLSVDRPVAVDQLSHLYQLSPAVSKVCRLLISGSTCSRIAWMRNVAVETIKSLVHSISIETSPQSSLYLVDPVLKTSSPLGLNERTWL